jgi:hypothetical protein
MQSLSFKRWREGDPFSWYRTARSSSNPPPKMGSVVVGFDGESWGKAFRRTSKMVIADQQRGGCFTGLAPVNQLR